MYYIVLYCTVDCTVLLCIVLQVRLVVVDNISRPLMRLVINSELQRALSLAARVTQLLHKVVNRFIFGILNLVK